MKALKNYYYIFVIVCKTISCSCSFLSRISRFSYCFKYSGHTYQSRRLLKLYRFDSLCYCSGFWRNCRVLLLLRKWFSFPSTKISFMKLGFRFPSFKNCNLQQLQAFLMKRQIIISFQEGFETRGTIFDCHP